MTCACYRLLRKASMSPLLSAIRSTPSSFAACNRSISSSRCSVLDDPLATYKSMENPRGGTLSAVGINHKGELLVGAPAKPFGDSQAQTETEMEMEMVPCRIVKAPNGDAWAEANGQKYSFGQIALFVLLYMKKFAFAHLVRFYSSGVRIPACFRDAQMEVTFDIEDVDSFSVLATDNAYRKVMEEESLIGNIDLIVHRIEAFLSKYRERTPAEIVTEFETAVCELKSALRLDNEEVLAKLEAAREAVSKIRQHMSKDTNSMEGEMEDALRTLSAVGINRKGKLLVGTSAKRFEDTQTEMEMEMVPCKAFKAPNGDAWVDVNGQLYTASQIATFLLLKMKELAEPHTLE
ncbi:PREDICTED: heat shock 70 kDa protein, mitochondrial-like isoform X2 [Tarenaya hassleriana]|nr:PREDICTED: heat shock 70 kDa protein, mitochondrial-like isoform X2 [Tarenaya hassleriana]